MLKTIFYTGILWLLMQITGCGTTAEITNTWVDAAQKKNDLQGILVVAVAERDAARVEFEDAFTQALQDKDLKATASHTLVPGDTTKEAILGVARLSDLYTILVIRYAGTIEEPVFHKGNTYYDVVPAYGGDYHRGFGGYYGHVQKAYSDPDVWTTNKYVTLVVDLYNTATEKPLWQASSRAIDPNDRDELRHAFVKAFVNELMDQKLLIKEK